MDKGCCLLTSVEESLGSAIDRELVRTCKTGLGKDGGWSASGFAITEVNWEKRGMHEHRLFFVHQLFIEILLRRLPAQQCSSSTMAWDALSIVAEEKLHASPLLSDLTLHISG